MKLNTTAVNSQARNRNFRVLGMMSGTSMDALDLVISEFACGDEPEGWSGRILESTEVPLGAIWPARFAQLAAGSAIDWFECERDWTRWCAKAIQGAMDVQQVDLVVFSGQTIFHRPEKGWTGQLGSGAELFASLGATVPVVSDLRSADVALGGQGAPLVPVADALLFSQYEACLNLGGFSNISLQEGGLRKAWDVGPCNLVLNALAQREGLAIDLDGRLAQCGQIIPALCRAWSELPYHGEKIPKSLGVEWLHRSFWPVLKDFERNGRLGTSDLLATATAYIASEIRLDADGKHTLITGGGTFNGHLMRALTKPADVCIRNVPVDAVVPSAEMIKGKEAHAFGFLGLLRWLGEANVWSSVTGCSVSHLGGALWGKNAVSSPSPNAMKRS